MNNITVTRTINGEHQDGDESALKVIQESTDTSAYAIEVGNAGGTKTSISGSGQVGIGTGTSTYNATLQVRSHIGGTGIVFEEDTAYLYINPSKWEEISKELASNKDLFFDYLMCITSYD